MSECQNACVRMCVYESEFVCEKSVSAFASDIYPTIS